MEMKTIKVTQEVHNMLSQLENKDPYDEIVID